MAAGPDCGALREDPSPGNCLPASGFKPVGPVRSQLLEVNGAVLPTRAYRFEDGVRPLHVYYCYWDGSVFRDTDEMIREDWTVRGRSLRVWTGRRNRDADDRGGSLGFRR